MVAQIRIKKRSVSKKPKEKSKQRLANIPKPRIRLSKIEEMQSYLRKEKPLVRTIIKPAKPCRVYRRYADKHRLLVILLRYGSLTEFSRPNHTFRQIEE